MINIVPSLRWKCKALKSKESRFAENIHSSRSIVPEDLDYKLVFLELGCNNNRMTYHPEDSEFKWFTPEIDGAFAKFVGHAKTPYGFYRKIKIFFSDYLARKSLKDLV